MVHLAVLIPFPLLQVWVSLGQGGDGFILVERTKGAGSMNSLGFTMTVWHTRQRDPHISKENDKQLAQNMCGGRHFVWTG